MGGGVRICISLSQGEGWWGWVMDQGENFWLKSFQGPGTIGYANGKRDDGLSSKEPSKDNRERLFVWPCGAMAAYLTPDQMVRCSNHTRVTSF